MQKSIEKFVNDFSAEKKLSILSLRHGDYFFHAARFRRNRRGKAGIIDAARGSAQEVCDEEQ